MTEQQSELSYEEARAELVEVVQRLEAGGTTLEESLALWERGEELAGICQDRLDGARARLQQALADTGDQDAPAEDDEGNEGNGEATGSPPF